MRYFLILTSQKKFIYNDPLMFQILKVMRFNRHIVNKFFSSLSSTEQYYRDLLLENLPLSREDIDKIVALHSWKFVKTPDGQIIRNCKICRDYNVQINSIQYIQSLLTAHSVILKHRIYLLNEMGVPVIDTLKIYKLSTDLTLPVFKFKEKMGIPKEQHIMTNLLSYINKNLQDTPPVKLLDEMQPVNMHYEHCFMHFLTCKLDIHELELPRYRGRKYKSIRLMTGLIDFFLKDIGFDLEYIRKHIYLFDLCPEEARYVMEILEDTKIGTLTLSEAVKKYPNLLRYDPLNTKEVLKSLRNYDITEAAVTNCLEILKVTNRELIQRMESFLKLPDIKVWCKNPRIIYFILYHRMVHKRIKFLRERGELESASVFILTCDSSYFQRYMQSNMSFTMTLKYMKYILSKELGSDKYLADILRRHPFWNRVSFVSVDQTLCKLKHDFSLEVICCNIHIILYPWSKIEKTLQTIRNCEDYQKYSLTSSQELALCLYLIEKENHFSGDGVWNLTGNHTEQRNCNITSTAE